MNFCCCCCFFTVANECFCGWKIRCLFILAVSVRQSLRCYEIEFEWFVFAASTLTALPKKGRSSGWVHTVKNALRSKGKRMRYTAKHEHFWCSLISVANTSMRNKPFMVPLILQFCVCIIFFFIVSFFAILSAHCINALVLYIICVSFYIFAVSWFWVKTSCRYGECWNGFRCDFQVNAVDSMRWYLWCRDYETTAIAFKILLGCIYWRWVPIAYSKRNTGGRGR